ncbi:hypothetical protein E5345_03430 [Propionibacterium sp. NM47_B9-13]|uniref:Uncharacterized protein n=2 Tax=Cutibacterium modestum TaxID=2559073 RepID=A0AAD1KSH8_9ACTN|nr:hypothetical protein [Cutibacterium modestum]MCP2377177.1 hypothetical protein [Cutibacterium modestum 28N]MCP2381779.1 hypothetical protein [Cutibacterium modestum 30N]TGY30299.1 hypothetical protein E5345_03430 [Propionibacterium sp. NM47_B9-13]AOH45699.1 hypothetical protein BCB70_07040 [Cutibacterium modestum]EFS74140.1 hypothetical protein HMPREF9621_01350 [Cutibacterium modestum HL037PA2]
MSRRRSEENTLDVTARLGHLDQDSPDVLGATTESARVSRSAGAFIVAMAITGLVWGLTLAIWATSPGVNGTRAGMPASGWFGSLLVGLLYAMGVTVILIIPVVLMAALLGGRLVRRRSQRIAGGVVGAMAVLLGAAGLYALIPVLSAVAEISWLAAITASALGCWWGPWVMVGRAPRCKVKPQS